MQYQRMCQNAHLDISVFFSLQKKMYDSEEIRVDFVISLCYILA